MYFVAYSVHLATSLMVPHAPSTIHARIVSSNR